MSTQLGFCKSITALVSDEVMLMLVGSSFSVKTSKKKHHYRTFCYKQYDSKMYVPVGKVFTVTSL